MIWNRIRNWSGRSAVATTAGTSTQRRRGLATAAAPMVKRSMRLESLEDRRLMAADAIHVGLVYIETDYLEDGTDNGRDAVADQFLLSFVGGAADTELRELRIKTQKAATPYAVGDLIFDTAVGGRGRDGAAGFSVLQLDTESGRPADVTATVADGGQELILQFRGFRSGDRMVFSIDVDQILFATDDLERFNSELDVIASGQEFQNSILQATFEAPNYFPVNADSVFRNEFADPWTPVGLDLPADEGPTSASRPNRSAASIASTTQRPIPASVSGFVYRDDNDSATKDAGEIGLAGVPIQLLPLETIEPQATLTTTTGADGSYSFNGIMPGRYRIVELQQPAQLADGRDSAGTINGRVVGAAVNPGDQINDVVLAGGQSGIAYNFGELPLGSLAGFVFLAAPGSDCDGDHDGDGDRPLVDVLVQLVNASGTVVATTRTGGDGGYRFNDLFAGTYTVLQQTPAGLLDGGSHVGEVRTLASGVVVGLGTSVDGGRISGIGLPQGGHGTQYNFCEVAPASLSGHVYHDRDNDGQRETGEEAIPNARLTLVDSAGRTVATTQTNAAGYYEFTQLASGVYRIVQTQPTGFIDGRDTVGRINGQINGQLGTDNDSIVSIDLRQGLAGINYDFGERRTASLAGRVHVDLDEDCVLDANEQTLAGVVIILQDGRGNEVARTTTNDQGRYRFDELVPGDYTVIELQPEGFFEGGAKAGSAGGRTDGPNRIGLITLGSGEVAVDYDFCERPPAEIAGFVYIDRDADCIRDAGEVGLAGVLVELFDEAGNLVASMRTGSDGSYRFTNLMAGSYVLRETQPTGFFHGGQVAGNRGGDASTADVISAIPIGWGDVLVDYNFCELLPSEIAGVVYVDRDADCIRDAGEEGLAGVLVELLDDSGRLVASTRTAADGTYSFVGLRAGNYTVRETQPTGFFHGGQVAGNRGGNVSAADVISSIPIGWGDVLVDYNFCERLPSEISGVVYVDRDADCVRDPGEEGLGGVLIELFDESGSLVGSTFTAADGTYAFDGLRAGNYTVRETQPIGFFHGGQVAGNRGGDASVADVISSISVGWGDVLVDYNFCELLPSEISGVVYVDRDADCVRDPGEESLAGVVIELFDIDDRRVAVTQTAADGTYRFGNLPPGVYTIRETQPAGYFHGGQVAGSGGGDDRVADVISAITLGPGQSFVNYDFCELPPSSISGRVWADTQRNRIFDASESPIAGVVIELIDGGGNVLSTTQTDTGGAYQFDGLAPGEYQVRQSQPVGYFHGGELVGSLGGRVVSDDGLGGIVLIGGSTGLRYDFPELPPATISGFVFQDGRPLVLAQSPDPARLREFRDGLLTEDDERLNRVTLQLRNVLGEFVDPSLSALPGTYAGDQIIVQTDQFGYYEFTGLRPGATYAVYQVQPTDFIDSLDTPGDADGFAVNEADLPDLSDLQLITLTQLSGNIFSDPNFDAILNLFVSPGQQRANNNFSEILIEPPPVVPPPEFPWFENLNRPATLIEEFDVARRPVGFAEFVDFRGPMVADDEWLVSWHLSVINGGYPDGQDGPLGDSLAAGGKRAIIRKVGFQTDAPEKTDGAGLPEELLQIEMSGGRWTIGKLSQDAVEEDTADGTGRMRSLKPGVRTLQQDDAIRIGHKHATALTGDFDGDGVDEPVLFVAGQWFVDFNGNGVWDSGDMWLRLGTRQDRPVVGDWDGDGKDDIGIFGRQWEDDDRRIRRDPGLPDAVNLRRRQMSREDLAPREARQEEKQQRLLARGQDGELLADAVDHVFQYGEQVDTPLAGDWNGDGIDQIGVFRSGQWLLDDDGDGRWTARDRPVTFGRPGDEPVVGDFDGDGIDEIGVVRGDVWIIDSDGDRKMTANDERRSVPRPSADSQPITGDFDGDKKDEPGYYDAA